MLSNTIQLTDGTTPLDYDLISREGMESIRRETVVDSSVAGTLIIKNTIDLNNSTTKNRHLIQLQEKQVDAVTGEVYEGSVHVVVARHKSFTDAELKIMLLRLADFISTSADVTDVLRGGN